MGVAVALSRDPYFRHSYTVNVLFTPEVAQNLAPEWLQLPYGTSDAMRILLEARVGDFLDDPQAGELTEGLPATIETFSSYFTGLQDARPASDDDLRRFLRWKTYWAERLGLPFAVFTWPEQLRFSRGIGDFEFFAKEERDHLWTFFTEGHPDGFGLRATTALLRELRQADHSEGRTDTAPSIQLVPRVVRDGSVHQVFLSHANTDHALASFVAGALRAGLGHNNVWVSSIPGEIPPGSAWFTEVLRHLAEADGYFILLTPDSLARPWVWFEGGIAYRSDHPFVIARAGGLAPAAVPSPYSELQTLSLEDPQEAIALFAGLRANLPDAEGFSATVQAHRNPERRDVTSEQWEGVIVGNRFFAWEGPALHALNDRPPIPEPAELISAIKAANWIPSFGTKANLRQYLAKGRKQVFETNRVDWRREVIYSADGDQVLLVHEE